MTTIPEPVPPPAHDNIEHALVPGDPPPDTFKTGEIDLNPERHDGFRFVDEVTGQTNEVTHVSEVGDQVVGERHVYDGDKEVGEPEAVILEKRRIAEARTLKFIKEHKKGTAVGSGAVLAVAVTVGTLIVSRRKRRG